MRLLSKLLGPGVITGCQLILDDARYAERPAIDIKIGRSRNGRAFCFALPEIASRVPFHRGLLVDDILDEEKIGSPDY
jgi:hypothetical protein